MTISECIEQRRSIRKYTDQEVEKENVMDWKYVFCLYGNRGISEDRRSAGWGGIAWLCGGKSGSKATEGLGRSGRISIV